MSKFILNNKKIILIFLIFLGILGLFFLNSKKKLPLPNLPLLKGEEQITKTAPQIYKVSFENNIPGEISVYDFMSKLQNEKKITFTEKNYISMGKFITTINGINGNGNKSWIYYVNNKKAQVGVSNYKINKGDIISWKYEKTY